jgi:hypothetical protein
LTGCRPNQVKSIWQSTPPVPKTQAEHYGPMVDFGERYANRISMLRVWLGFAG